jgi:hypothetical protein
LSWIDEVSHTSTVSVGPLTLCYHSGHNSGFNSFNAWIPERELTLAILANDDSIDPDPQEIAKDFLEGNPELLAS